MLAPIRAGNFVSSGPVPTERAEPRWRVWGRSAFALAVVLLLAGLGIANIALHGKWHEVEDGAFWGARPEGIVAVEVLAGSPAARAGITPGDLLLAINGEPVQTRA
ncbi:MAG: PDZ domain-containing protein, partial [Acidobacteriota bacterium]